MGGLFPPGAGLGTQSLGVCQSPGGGRDEFPGLLAGCLPPSAHLLLSQMFSSFFLLPPSPVSSSYASPVHWLGMWGAVWGVLWEGGWRDRPRDRPQSALSLRLSAGRRGEGRGGGFGTWPGGERGCCINQKQSRNSCLWPGNTSMIPGSGKGDVYIYVYTLRLPRTTPPEHHLILCFLFIDLKEAQEGPGGLR